MAKITSVIVRKVLDSRGNWTAEADVVVDKKYTGRAAAPGGASKGAFEVRDYPNGGIDFGLRNFKENVTHRLIGRDPSDQKGFDKTLHEIDGTGNFSSIGGNIAIAASLANAKAAAKAQGVELYRLILKRDKAVLPYPVGNIIGGGKHAINGTVMQEFLTVAFGKRYQDSAFANVTVHKRVGELLRSRFPEYPIGLGDEKAWVAAINDTDAIEIIAEAIGYANQRTGIELKPAIDLAASSFFSNGTYDYKERSLTTPEQIDFVAEIVDRYSVKIVEDPLEENDFGGFAELTKRIGNKAIVVGDDLFVTNRERLQRGIELGSANGVLIKPNQIGTLSDMIETVELAKRHNYETVISHRSGETEDSTIAHLAVGLGIKYIKTGTIGGERTAKHNELIRIEELESK